MDVLRGRFLRTRYAFDPDAAETRGIWMIDAADDIGEVAALGKMPRNLRTRGLELSLFGRWKVDPKWGNQFHFSHCSVVRSHGKFATLSFLQQADGIGPVTANKIWDEFGDDSINVLASKPELVSSRLSNTQFDIEAASEYMRSIVVEADIKAPLISLFAGIPFPKTLIDKVLQIGGDVVGKVTANPFILIEFHGVGFAMCDQLRKKLGLSRDMPERKRAAAIYAIKSATGDVWVPSGRAYTLVKDLVGIDHKSARRLYNELYKQRHIAHHKKCLAIAREYEIERSVCRLLVSKNDQASWPSLGSDDGLTDHQRSQLEAAQRNGSIAVLLGSAGTGKTYSVASVIKSFPSSANIYACSPTGKAAQRLFQSLVECRVKHVMPTTIHSMLQATPTGNGWQFAIDGIYRTLPADLLIVDEASMIDNQLMNHLLMAIQRGTFVLIVGDPNQLSPIGRGTFLRDWPLWCDKHKLGSYGMLTKIHRNTGAVIRSCNKIYTGGVPKIMPYKASSVLFDVTSETNLRGIRAVDDDAIALAAERVARKYLELYGSHTGLQFVVATNNGTPASKNEMNKMLQLVFNSKNRSKRKFWKDDKIICTHNSRRMSLDGIQIYTANGAFGTIVECGDKPIVVMDDSPTSRFELSYEQLCDNYDLGYAVSCHRMQGSQDAVVFVALSDSFKSKLVTDRSWVYTALTRSTQLSIVAGTQDTLKQMCKRTKISDRISFIPEWLTEECNGTETQCLYEGADEWQGSESPSLS